MAVIDRAAVPESGLGPNYKWIALSNTTLGMLMATINSSIVLIALPDIFRGIGINPLEPGNTSYLLWMIMGFLVVTAVLVVGFGRLGDMFGRVRMYNLGFAVFTVASIFLWLTWQQGDAAALWLIGWRIVQGIGGAFLMANSSAILTDAFPREQRGLALGINGVAAIAGSFFGLVIGGLLGPIDWKLVFLVSVPFGLFGTVWAYLKLHDTGERHPAKMDWWGNITFAVGLIAILVGITYGIQPYGDSVMGWGSPTVLVCLIGGFAVLVAFVLIERRVDNPLFTLSLFRNRRFTLGNLANLLGSLGRGGLQFMLIIWLQGIWLPQHGYSFEETPLWAGIYMLPLTVGFLVAAPISGVLSDRYGARWFSTGGLLISAVSFALMIVLPINFGYVPFAIILLVNGLGMGLFSSPNRADIMNSLPGDARGAGSGMTATFQNAAMVLSIGFFFSLMIAGLSTNLPSVMASGLTEHGVPASEAARIAGLPPVAVLFAAFLGYNPIQQLLGPVLGSLPPDQAAFLTGRSFFPQLITGPFADGLFAAFSFAVIACIVAAVASWFAGGRTPDSRESVGGELAAVAGEQDGLAELVVDDFVERPRRASAGELIGHLSTGGAPGVDAVVTVTDREGRQIARSTPASDGDYRVSGLEPGTYTAVATAPGFRPAVAAVTLNGVGVVHDFSLDGNGVVTGSVTGPDGRACTDALVIATTADGRVVGRCHTAMDGSFRIAGIPVGPTTIAASVAEHEPDAVTVLVDHAGTAVADLVLASSAGFVTGTVHGPDGAPLGSATVVATDANGDVVARAGTDASGRYELLGIRSGIYTVVASLLTPASARVRVVAGEPVRADLRLGDPAGERLGR